MASIITEMDGGQSADTVSSASPEGNVVEFKRADNLCGDGLALYPDQILEAAKGAYLQVVVVGFDRDGQIDIRSSHGSRDALWILRRGEYYLLLETK